MKTVECGSVQDKLSLLRGCDVIITPQLRVKQPTLEEIASHGEGKYLHLLSSVLTHPFDMIGQLYTAGIDFTEISEFELFCIMMSSTTPDITSIMFGDVNFNGLRTVKPKESNELIAVTQDGVIINQYNYKILCDYLRTLHNFAKPKYSTVGNEFTKNMLIQEALDEMKQTPKNRKAQSFFAPLISALVNHAGFKYNYDTVWGLTVYQLMDAMKRIGVIENSGHLYTGIYSGCIEVKNVKKELNWMRAL